MKKNLFFLILLAFAAFSAFAQVGSMNLRFVDTNGNLHTSRLGAAIADQQSAAGIARVQGNIGVQAPPVFIQHQQQPIQFVAVPNAPGYFAGGGVQYHCSALRSTVGAGIGALVGYVVGKNIHIHGGTMSAGGTIGGAFIGKEIACEMVQQPVSAGTLGNQGVSVGTSPTRVCPADTSWKMLDWQGHPDHGKQLCLPSEEKLQEQKAAFSGQNVTPTARKCGGDTTWKTLDWPGHPQHGKFACLPSDEKIAQQKASSGKAP